MPRAVPGRTGGTLAAGTRTELEADGAEAAIGSRSELRLPVGGDDAKPSIRAVGWNGATLEEAFAATSAGAAGSRDDRNPT